MCTPGQLHLGIKLFYFQRSKAKTLIWNSWKSYTPLNDLLYLSSPLHLVSEMEDPF
jgi:hypothetical protein